MAAARIWVSRPVLLGAVVLIFCSLHGAEPPSDRDSTIISLSDRADAPGPTELQDLFGVNTGPLPALATDGAYHGGDISAELADLGVSGIRNHDYYDGRLDIGGLFNSTSIPHNRCANSHSSKPQFPCWEPFGPSDPSALPHNWGPSNNLWDAIVNGGFEPLLRLGDSIKDEIQDYDFRGPQTSTEIDHWIEMAQLVVDHYYNRDSPTAVEYVEIFNEPDDSRFWDRPFNVFRPFFYDAFSSIESAYPSIQLGGPGFAGQTSRAVSSASLPNRAHELLGTLYDGGSGPRPDFISFHLYFLDPQDMYDAARSYRDLLDSTGAYAGRPWSGSAHFAGTKLLVTEYNVALQQRGLTSTEMESLNCHGLGAALLTGGYIALQLSGEIERAYVYKASDPLAGACSGRTHGMIKRRSAGTLSFTQRARAFRLWTRQYQGYNAQRLAGHGIPHLTSGAHELWVLATKNSADSVAVLIANPDTYSCPKKCVLTPTSDVDYRIETTIGGTLHLMSSSFWSGIDVFQVDDSNNGRIPVSSFSSGYRGQITIPRNSVQLVILHH